MVEVSVKSDTNYFHCVKSMIRNDFLCLCKQTCRESALKAWSERAMEKDCQSPENGRGYWIRSLVRSAYCEIGVGITRMQQTFKGLTAVQTAKRSSFRTHS
jgi:hypothetical protein